MAGALSQAIASWQIAASASIGKKLQNSFNEVSSNLS
jgi:hypothetical protein